MKKKYWLLVASALALVVALLGNLMVTTEFLLLLLECICIVAIFDPVVALQMSASFVHKTASPLVVSAVLASCILLSIFLVCVAFTMTTRAIVSRVDKKSGQPPVNLFVEFIAIFGTGLSISLFAFFFTLCLARTWFIHDPVFAPLALIPVPACGFLTAALLLMIIECEDLWMKIGGYVLEKK